MHISRIFIRNFRNFRELDLPIHKGVTCFIGENNSGKTNLMQAVRLVLDGSISPYRRRLTADDLSVGLSFKAPQHVLISVELTGFTGKPSEEALPFDALIAPDLARFTYRFRPKPIVRDALKAKEPGILPLTLDHYRWEMVGGGDDLDLSEVQWSDDFGVYSNTDVLQQGYLVVVMEALRDVEARLSQVRTSPLQQILDQCKFPEPEQDALVGRLKAANQYINDSTTIKTVGGQITKAFRDAAGATYAMNVALGLADPGFGDICKSLKVLLSGYGMQDFPPERNGLGLNNVLYISMLLNCFERRVQDNLTAGQLLLIEEPEAHLHPQLQRILLATLQSRNVQVFITTHSTHVTSGTDLSAQVILSNGGTAITSAVQPANIPELDSGMKGDLERYLDATRSTLLFARAVMLVEGPAEQFLIPPLVKAVLKLDLDELGVAVVPIFGTHFEAYARLFGPNGIPRRCAIVADGDLGPSDASDSPDLEDELEDSRLPSGDLSELENEFVKVFQSKTTFELEMTLEGNLLIFAGAASELGAARTAKRLKDAADEFCPDLPPLGQYVLKAAKRFGKARFSQIASRLVDDGCELPEYIREAVLWLTSK